MSAGEFLDSQARWTWWEPYMEVMKESAGYPLRSLVARVLKITMIVITAAMIPAIMQGQLKSFGLVPKILPVKIEIKSVFAAMAIEPVLELLLRIEVPSPRKAR